MTNTFPNGFLDGKTGMRWFGDVHGSREVDYAIEDALAKNLAIGFIGDLTDQSHKDTSGNANDSAHVLRRVIGLIRDGSATMVPGNHCAKLFRYFTKVAAGDGSEKTISRSHGLDKTIDEIMTSEDSEFLIEGLLDIIGNASLWHRSNRYVFAHAGATGGMFFEDPPRFKDAFKKKSGIFHRALYGETNGEKSEDGFPVRLYDWVDRLHAGEIVVIGHDIRKQITYVKGAQGGTLIHIDTGAGKGGHLSYLDLTVEELASV